MTELAKPAYGVNENAEYLDIVWGVLRVPVVCTRCGALTRTPAPLPVEGDPLVCGRCWHNALYAPSAGRN